MRSTAFFALFPSLLWSANLVAVPSPLGPDKSNLPLEDGYAFGTGKWVVQDTLKKGWYTTNSGATWDSIPERTVRNGVTGGVFGTAYVSSDDMFYWKADSGWKAMVFPAGFSAGEESYISTTGERAWYHQTTKRVDFYRTSDNFRSWTSWFSMDASKCPSADWFGFTAMGKVWYTPSDSGYLRGTSDGIKWTKISLPTGFMLLSSAPDPGDTTLELLGMDAGNPGAFSMISTRDFGATWQTKPLDDPNSSSAPVGPGTWASQTISSTQGIGFWLSKSPNGPWTKIDTTGTHGVFGDSAATYLLTNTGLYRVDGVDVGIRRQVRGASFSPKREGNHWNIELPAQLRDRAWALVAADGSVLQSGARANSVLRIESPRTDAWLRIGNQSVPLPRF